jgi:tagatose-6-phosphate ketose/aldose isomerase
MNALLDLVQLPIEERNARGLMHTPQEIAQQPATWIKTLRIFHREQSRLIRFLEEAGLRGPLEHRPIVVLIGAGTSDYIGQALTLLLRQHWQCEVQACASTDLLPILDSYIISGRKYLWISFSRSGDSPEGVALLEEAERRYPGIAHLVVTCNPDARMKLICERMQSAHAVVLDDATNDRSLAMTSSFTNMMVLGHCLAHAWSIHEYERIAPQLSAAGETVLLEGYPLAASIASRNFPRACFIGTGPLAAVARESALKVLEMSAGRIKTMAETTLGLRHGPMAALDEQTLFICFVSGATRGMGYAVDLLREVAAKQITAQTIVVGPAGTMPVLAPYCDAYLSVNADVSDEYRSVLDVLFGQMLGLCASIANDLKPDSPSPDGIINRVVQDFAIYR